MLDRCKVGLCVMWNKRSADFSGSVLSVSVNQQPRGGCFALSDPLDFTDAQGYECDVALC